MSKSQKRDELDRYTGSDGQTHARFRLGPHDQSPTVRVHSDPARRYHPRCSGCYLGNAHSEAYHDKHATGSW